MAGVHHVVPQALIRSRHLRLYYYPDAVVFEVIRFESRWTRSQAQVDLGG